MEILFHNIAVTKKKQQLCNNIISKAAGNGKCFPNLPVQTGTCSIYNKWDPRPRISGGTQDVRQDAHLMGQSQDVRPGTLKVGLKIWDHGLLLYMGPETQDTEKGTWEPYHRWDLRPQKKHLLPNLKRKNYELWSK